MEQDQAFLEYIVQAIVNNPEDVKSTRTVDERGVLITLDLNPSDMGYVIGRRGQTARAIRTLLKVVGAKNNARVNLKINEPEGGRQYAPAASVTPVTPVTPVTSVVPVTPVAPFVDDIDTSAVENLNI